MADENKTSNSEPSTVDKKSIQKTTGTLNGLLDQIYFTANGIPRSNNITELDNRFTEIMNGEVDSVTKASNTQLSSFIAKLFEDDQQAVNYNPFAKNMSMFEDSGTNVQGLFTEAYKNRLIKQNDLHEVASQLIELREAILVTRDAITSSDIVDGQMSRSLNFEGITDANEDYVPIVEDMEKNFNLQTKIKNFIVPHCLEYGEYYVYRIPYSKLFEDFMAAKDDIHFLGNYTISEKTLLESVNEDYAKEKKKPFSKKDAVDEIIQEFKDGGYFDELKEQYNVGISKSRSFESEVRDDLTTIMSNVTICNSPVPLNIIEEGVETVYEYFKEEGVADSLLGSLNQFKTVTSLTKDPEGLFLSKPDNLNNFNGGKRSRPRKHQFANIKDCYIKLIDPTRILPIKMMDKVIGYYYVTDEEISPISGVISSNMYTNQFDMVRKDRTIVDAIASRIVKSFDKKFLKSNLKFKDTIVEALNYFNLNERKIRFQYIPAEYMTVFKVDEDVNGDGTSIIEPSLFYAKLYLILLLFRIMSILINSNDMKVNYIRSSGIDKNVRNKIEEIARAKQNRQINVMDLFNYTNLIRKIGAGAELYIPTGKGNERGIETEILSGQDIQPNTDLMELLKNQMILGTGVPSAILNYLNEADFAKSLELANNKFAGRVISYQIDFNGSITTLYKYLMRECTNIPENVIESFTFSFAQPKTANNQIKQDLIQNFDTYANWVLSIFYGDNAGSNPDLQPEITEVKLALAKSQLPMINIEELRQIISNAKVYAQKTRLEPSNSNDEELEG